MSHIARHGVTPWEVEEALTGAAIVFRGRDGRYLAHGRSEGGRLLFVAYITRPRGRIRVITARDMKETERRLWRRRRAKGQR